MKSRGIEKRIKAAGRYILSASCYLTGYSLALLKGRVAILMYHRVIAEKDLKRGSLQPGMYVRKDVFERQMLFLKDHFEILTFFELLDIFKKKTWDKEKRYCLITFDDGWVDNYRHAYPVLRKNDIPAAIFLPTALIGTCEWFWPEKISYVLWQFSKIIRPDQFDLFLRKYTWLVNIDGGSTAEKIDTIIERCKELPDEDIQKLTADMITASGIRIPQERLLMNWTEIREMSQSGISFGSHSCTHKILTRLAVTELRKEIEDSMAALRVCGVRHAPVFCYPNGNYTPEIAAQVKKAGYQAAVTTAPGVEKFQPESVFRLRRIGIHNDISSTIPLFAYRLSCGR